MKNVLMKPISELPIKCYDWALDTNAINVSPRKSGEKALQ